MAIYELEQLCFVQVLFSDAWDFKGNTFLGNRLRGRRGEEISFGKSGSHLSHHLSHHLSESSHQAMQSEARDKAIFEEKMKSRGQVQRRMTQSAFEEVIDELRSADFKLIRYSMIYPSK